MEKYKFKDLEGFHGSHSEIVELAKLAQESGFSLSEQPSDKYWTKNDSFVWGDGIGYFFSATRIIHPRSFNEMKSLLTQHLPKQKKEKYIFQSEIGVECNTEQEMRHLAQLAIKGEHPISESDISRNWEFNSCGQYFFKYGTGLKCLFMSGYRPEKTVSFYEMAELLTQHLDVLCEREEIIKKKLPIPETVIIPADLFREGWSQMGRELQLKYQDKVNAYTGKCKSSDLQELYDEICSSWKTKLEQEFPWLSEPRDLNVDVRQCIINSTAFAPKSNMYNRFDYLISCEDAAPAQSFCLNETYNWKLEGNYLTPEKKK